MDLKEYQARALETALPTALNWDYIATNLLAETHEFAAKIYGAEAKKIRDGKEPDKKNLTAELGDIAWHIAVGLSLEDKGEYHGAMYVENPEDKDYMAYELVDNADQCYRFGLTNDRRLQVKYLQYMWRLLTCCAESALGVPLNQVLEANLAKLADRKTRGVITGSGDNR